jgi:hypothetical protein
MVYSLKLTFVANGNNPTDVEFAPDEIICFGSLEFSTDLFSNLSLSPKREGLYAIFVGMVMLPGRSHARWCGGDRWRRRRACFGQWR